jgi:ABC-type polar amino acid transport system ATPase subunit
MTIMPTWKKAKSLDVLEGLARDGMTMVVGSHELSLADHVPSSILMMDEAKVMRKSHQTVSSRHRSASARSASSPSAGD